MALWAERVSESEMKENFIVGVAEYKQKSNPVIPLEPNSPH
jgi:methylmalonyl-CoA mutase N-terminal domain/subunit